MNPALRLMAARTAASGKTLAFLQFAEDTSDLTTYTLASQNLGTAAGDRHIIASVFLRATSNTALTFSSVTIGGVAATIVAQVHATTAGNSTSTAIVVAEVPTGTTGDVVIVASRACIRAAVGLYRATGITTTAYDSATDAVSTYTTTAVGVPDGGFVIIAANTAATGSTWTWVGADEDFDAASGETAFMRYGGASRAYPSGDAGPTLTATPSVAPTDACAAFASW